LLLTAEVSVRAETDLGTVVILVAAKECFKLTTHLPEAARGNASFTTISDAVGGAVEPICSFNAAARLNFLFLS
jgi:hypothetical protein